MGVPFEALLPYGIIVGLFGVTGIGMTLMGRLQNHGKRPRRGIDTWDRQSRCLRFELPGPLSADTPTVMERDLRLTGSLRGQSDTPIAPPGFALNSPWKVRKSPTDIKSAKAEIKN
ncbi:hypothetical protein LOZ53_002472 [Ophidiomyces ophidiicola]|uniref:uncharacterized protein n=1 Tax=Ophidiomyces ophidiicola TaxID=1387563 RepID=UPI0020C36864|nr:uncharacterized protein LOZ57_004534 [Ophidiomyces ophidiicola]KAI1913473.1 hypothetical protein LOZ64_004092 [Ophidiomyces ophidiicola]KAI1932753.1 hypothetical protein LOZ62_006575 [Ophidiomyces ophidiicola]KAI1944862.1 hypothetical protein LOZ57_004534 [Ophidiomyces ophidiicola]KAI1977429.1 hypothetical protein LOZ55_003518 [Ophidiomyces ophidiicola]KAI1992540.1 hypothetical protein LOZ53_002472 [Ophidiomyces ophidiicola]